MADGGNASAVATAGAASGGEKATAKNADVVFVLGGPGTGKGTVCTSLSKEFSLTHLSMGDLLRAEVARGTDVGKEIHRIIDGGNIVPSVITVAILKDAVFRAREADGVRGVLVDGFPRSMEQLEAWDFQVGDFGLCINLTVDDDEVLVRRILGRAAAGQSDRTDDDEATVRKRLQVHKDNCEACVDHYREAGRVSDINADRKPEEVLADTRKLVEAHFALHKL